MLGKTIFVVREALRSEASSSAQERRSSLVARVSGLGFRVSSCWNDLQHETRNEELETFKRDTLHGLRERRGCAVSVARNESVRGLRGDFREKFLDLDVGEDNVWFPLKGFVVTPFETVSFL